MNYWDSVGRWINTLLLFIVGVISFDTLFRLLEAQQANLIVRVTRLLATIVLAPFHGMFGEQEYVRTATVAVLGYALLVGIALSVLRGIQATRPYRPAGPEAPRTAPPATGSAQPQRSTARTPARSDNPAPRAPARTDKPPARTAQASRTAGRPSAAGGTPDAPTSRAEPPGGNGRPASTRPGVTPRARTSATARPATGTGDTTRPVDGDPGDREVPGG